MEANSIEENYLLFIQQHRQLLEIFQYKVNDYLRQDTTKELSASYIVFKNRTPARSFNIFRLVSNIYYRENFHSDILKAFLDPIEMHDEGDKYLLEFICYLKNIAPVSVSLNSNNYQQAEVKRELGRVDILIRDSVSKHAIIVENKINRAGDQIRQTPNYHDDLVEQGYTVDAVIYVLLNYHLGPETQTWTEDDRQNILPKLIVVKANDDTPHDMVSGWLQPCAMLSRHEENRFVINQYIHLLKQLGELAMNKEIMGKFYEQLKVDDNYNTALSVRDMFNQLSNYRVERLIDTFRDYAYPFERVWNWQNKAAVLDGARYIGKTYKIDIVPTERNCAVQFIENQTEEKTISSVISELGYGDYFTPIGDRLQRIFLFPSQEDELYSFIKEFQKGLATLIQQNSKGN